MINLLIFAGLIFVIGLSFTFIRKSYALLFIIPSLFLFAFAAKNYYTNFAGYAITENFMEKDKDMLFLYGYEAGPIIYAVTVDLKTKIPRFISMDNNTANNQALKSAQQKSKSSPTIIRLHPTKESGTPAGSSDENAAFEVSTFSFNSPEYKKD